MIFLELVPSNINQLIEQSHWALTKFSSISGINVPDILKINTRSYEAASELTTANVTCIPHLRICDFSFDELIALCESLQSVGICNILLISGDPPPNPLQPVFKHNIVKIIANLTTAFPDVSFYAGHDPYRQSFKDELTYSQKKLDAGAKGLFTQPIFDVHLVNMLLEHCQPCEWFIGISPVLTEKSYNYWTSRNNVVFPPNFELSMAHNVSLAKTIIQTCNDHAQHNYIMPITCGLSPYLDHVFDEKTN